MKSRKKLMCFLLVVFFILGTIALIPVLSAAVDEPDMLTYVAEPLILSASVKPNVLIIQDNSGSMAQYAFGATYNPGTTYDGLFEADKKYVYDSSLGGGCFEIAVSPSGTTGIDWWEGNFLNWACVRRIDINKRALTGGLYAEATDDGKTVYILSGHRAARSSLDDDPKYYNYITTTTGSEDYDIRRRSGEPARLEITDGSTTYEYYIKVKTTEKPLGIVQELSDSVSFGLEIFNDDAEGGEVVAPIDMKGNADAVSSNLVTRINGITPATNTPLGETFFTALGYFGQFELDHDNGPMYHDNDYPLTPSGVSDPYADSASCIKSFVILITDGEANNDAHIAETYRTWPAGSTDPTSGNSHYLDNVAFWAHINDIRPDGAGTRAITGKQILTLYTVYTFGDGTGTALLQNAAKWGGFKDLDNNNRPDDAGAEWDVDPKNTIPDNYFEADSVKNLKTSLNKALTSILNDVSSGSAVSLLSTNTQNNEGTVIQAYFRPFYNDKDTGNNLKWVGYLHSFWLDRRYNLREDTVVDGILNVEEDKIIQFVAGTGDVKIKRYAIDENDPYATTGASEDIALTDTSLKPLWDAGKRLHNRDSDTRKIFTFLDADPYEGETDDDDSFDGAGEVVRFVADNETLRERIKPYLGVTSGSTEWDYLGTIDNRVTNLINWIRGDETGILDTMRSRKIGSTTKIWKLGDIINSTPTSVGNPQQRYDALYGDLTYTEFRRYIQSTMKRENVVYVGANDGMLHAFTAGVFNAAENKLEPGVSGENPGEELWAYIPQALLPHLKWLPKKDYEHVFYVDLTPVIMDARIFEAGTEHPNGWGTILLCGLNWGGKKITVPDFFSGPISRDFSASYFCLDITDPLKPKVLWERTYQNLGLSTSKPAIVRIGDASENNKSQWFAVFGSGPTDYKGVSAQAACVFVVDLKTGAPYSLTPKQDWFAVCTDSAGVKGYMNSPVSYDKYLDYEVDGVYFGETYQQSGVWKGKIWKLPIPDAGSGPNKKVIDPANWSSFYSMLSFNAPVSGAVSVGVGKGKTPYVFFGTGRYMDDADKISNTQQYLVGLKDPEANTPYLLPELYDAADAPADQGPLQKGWYYELSGPRERSLTKPVVYAGAAIFTSFIPSDDICGFGGNSYLYINGFFDGEICFKTDLGTGMASDPIIRPDDSKGQGRKISVLGMQGGGINNNQGIAISQSSTGAIINKGIVLPSVPRSKFIYWREP